MKKKQKLFLGFTVLVITVISTMAGCGSSDFKPAEFPFSFIGTWERVGRTKILIFTPTTMEDSNQSFVLQREGTYGYVISPSYDTKLSGTVNIKIVDNNLVISSDYLAGNPKYDWAGTWRRINEQKVIEENLAQTQTQTQPQFQAQLTSTTPEPVKDDDFEVRQNTDNTITITGYKGTAKNLVIPDTLYGLKVTVIGNSAFQEKGLISVVIPDTVITIESGKSGNYNLADHNVGAFYNNKGLIKVTLGKSIETIGDYAFGRCHINEIIIPDSVTRIGACSFIYTGLTKVTFGKGLQVIGESAFYSSSDNYLYYETTAINNNQITEIIFPSSIKEIGEFAFCNNIIQELTLGTGLQTIGRYAFSENKIHKLSLGTSLQIIGENAFSNNQINELNFTLPSSLKTIPNWTFANNQIQSVTIPNSITALYRGAFNNNPLATVVIPASLANGRIDSQSFGNIDGSTITRITIPAGMNENTLRGIFEVAFINFWINQNKAGGTYVKRGPIWARE